MFIIPRYTLTYTEQWSLKCRRILSGLRIILNDKSYFGLEMGTVGKLSFEKDIVCWKSLGTTTIEHVYVHKQKNR